MFSSFFGALMVASFFFYYKYKFSTYKFIDFSRIILYERKEIFIPKKEKYTLILFSSKRDNLVDVIKKIKTPYPILAIDIFQKRFDSNSTLTYTTAGINTIIKIIQYLNIYSVPVAVDIKRYQKSVYKQDSPMVKIIE